MPRDQYIQTFKEINPTAGDAALNAALASYDKDAQARAQAGGNAVQDRFAALESPEKTFTDRLNKRLQQHTTDLNNARENKAAPAIVPALPGRQEDPKQYGNIAVPSITDKTAGVAIGGLLKTLMGSAAAGYAMLGDDKTAQEFDQGRAALEQRMKELGAETMPGRVSEIIGSVAPALFTPESLGAQLTTSTGLFGIPAFRDTYKAQVAAGHGTDVALEHAAAAAGLNVLLPMVAPGGMGALSKSLSMAEMTGVRGAAASLGQAGAEGAGFSALSTATDKGIDTLNGVQNDNRWFDPTDMTANALAFGGLRVPHAVAVGMTPSGSGMASPASLPPENTMAAAVRNAYAEPIISTARATPDAISKAATIDDAIAAATAAVPTLDATALKAKNDSVVSELLRSIRPLDQPIQEDVHAALADDVPVRDERLPGAEDSAPGMADPTAGREGIRAPVEAGPIGTEAAGLPGRESVSDSDVAADRQHALNKHPLQDAFDQTTAAYNAAVHEFNAAKAAGDVAGMHAAKAKIDEVSRESLQIKHQIFLEGQKIADVNRQAQAVKTYGAMPEGTKIGMAGLEGSDSSYWQKVGPNRWQRTMDGKTADIFKTDTEMDGKRVIGAKVADAGIPINKDWHAFPDNSGTLGIPRAEMPQIKAEHRGAMVNFLNARGIEHEEVDAAGACLKPTQAEFSPEKVQQAKDYQGGDRSILVSADGHVLDGHHQWLAKLEAGEPIKAIRLQAPIRDLLGHVKEFPSAQVSEGASTPAMGGMRLLDNGTKILSEQRFSPEHGAVSVVDPTTLGGSGIGDKTISAGFARFLQSMGQALGKDIHFFQQEGAKTRLDGFAPSAHDKALFVNIHAGDAAWHYVAGHEFFHQMPEELKSHFIDAIKPMIKPEAFESLKKYINQDHLDDAGHWEEIAADLFGNRFGEKGFFDKLLANMPDRSTAARVFDYIRQFIDKMTQALGAGKQFKTDRFVDDIDRVRAAAADALERYLNGKGAPEPLIGGKHVADMAEADLKRFAKSKGAVGDRARAEIERRKKERASMTPAERRQQAIAELAQKSDKQLRDITRDAKSPIYLKNEAADVLAERQAANSAKRSDIAKKAWSKAKGIDSNHDSMAAAIAKLGGINRDSASGRMRLAPEELAVTGHGIQRVFTNKGRTMDEMGAALADLGYVNRDEHGKYDQSDFEEKLAEVASGNEVYTPEAMMRRAAEDHSRAMEEVGAHDAAEFHEIEDHADALDHHIADPDAWLEKYDADLQSDPGEFGHEFDLAHEDEEFHAPQLMSDEEIDHVAEQIERAERGEITYPERSGSVEENSAAAARESVEGTRAPEEDRKDLTAEEKIRASFNAGSRTIGSWHGITVDHNGVTQNFLANQKKLATGHTNAAIHLVHIKMGKMLKTDAERKPIATYYKLDGKNNLAEEGVPGFANERQVSMWKKEGFPLDDHFLQSHDSEDLKNKDARDNDRALSDKQIADAQREAFTLSAPEGTVTGEANAMANTRQEPLFSKNRSDENKEFFANVTLNTLRDTGFSDSIDKDGNVLMYHGTSSKNAAGIEKSGKFKDFPFFAPDRATAEKFSRQAGKNPTVIEVRIEPGAILPTGGYFSARMEGLKRDADGVWRIGDDAKYSSQRAPADDTLHLDRPLSAQSYEVRRLLRNEIKRIRAEAWQLGNHMADPDKADERVTGQQLLDRITERLHSTTEAMQYLHALGVNKIGDDGGIKSSAERKPVFYSQLERSIDQVPAKVDNTSAANWKAWLLNNAGKMGVKADEIKWSGITDYLDLMGKQKLSKDHIKEYLQNNGVQVQEVMKGEGEKHNDAYEWGALNDEHQDGTKYGKYVLPGGENYRELLLTLPEKQTADHFEDGQLEYQPMPDQYKSSHWDEPNILAHVRFDDHTDAEGKRVLMIQELQSDWGQEGKKYGFKDNELTPEEEKEFIALDNEHREDGLLPDAMRRWEELGQRMRAARQAVPSAPFVTDTKAWLSLGLKRMIRYAAENGYDKIAFVNGEQSADRYDLSKQISRIQFDDNSSGGIGKPRMEGPIESGMLYAYDLNGKEVISKHVNAPAEVEDLIGKEAAKRLLEQSPKEARTAGLGVRRRELSGLDLKVGGEGMKAFYDRIVPQVASDVLKKLGGGKVGEVTLDASIPAGGGGDGWGKVATGIKRQLKQTGFDITPELRAKAMEGMPLFSQQRKQIDTPEFKRWFGDSKVVDADGKPLVVYHSTTFGDFNEFDKPSQRKGMAGYGFYFTDKDGSNIYADYGLNFQASRDWQGNEKKVNIMPVYLRMENPLIIDNIADVKDTYGKRDPGQFGQGRKYGGMGEAAKTAIQRDGYDGVITNEYVKRQRDGSYKVVEPGTKGSIKHPVYVVFEPEQIKSATGNNGAFDPANPDIRYASQRNPLRADYDGPGAKLIDTARGTMKEIIDDLVMKTAPMAHASGADEARSIAKNWANADRVARYQWTMFDHVLKKNYTDEQRRTMWEAADEENVLRQQGLPTTGLGLDRLPADQRATMETLHAYAEGLLQRAKDSGMFQGEGLPYWTPRMAALIGEDGEYARVSSVLGGGSSEQGRNIISSASSLKQRKYLTAAETEAAMKAKFGEDAQIVRDIRTMPLAMARLERAIAGRELVNQIKELGTSTGIETVSTSEGPQFFTLDHPAFKRYTPRFVKDEEGKMIVATDQNGDPVFDRVPVYISKDFEGPLKAIMSDTSGKLYQGFMALKTKTMGLIMYSPLIHNAVEWGRALPVMPGKVLTFRVYFEGNRFRNDPTQMRTAIKDGMVPIGHRGMNQDLVAMMNDPTILPGRSWTAKLIGGAVGMLNEKAGTKVKKGIDKAGEIWHEALLWDRVADLQAGLYANVKADMVRKGINEATAGKLAAHFANRYAGALPNEAMSVNARKIANFVLFSRSFTLGNLGALKDIATGLPKDVQSQIKMESGEASLKLGKSIARRKAGMAFALDLALLYVGNSLLQDTLDKMKRDKSLSDIEQGYVDRFQRLIHKVKESPMSLLNPFFVPENMASTADNEPGKEDRIHYDNEESGTAVYLRLPTGKIGEEFKGWMSSPLQTLLRKQGTVMRPITQTIENDKGFGRRVYDPEAEGIEGAAKNLGRIVMNFMAQQVPLDSAEGAMDWVEGNATTTDKLKAAGPLMGLTFSKGAPGGPAVGEQYYVERKHQGDVMDILPDVQKALKRGDKDKAIELMQSVNMTPPEMLSVIRRNEAPESRLNKNSMKRFNQHASDEDKDRMNRLNN
jgi:hypothetical protein